VKHVVAGFGALVSSLFLYAGVAESVAPSAPPQPISATVRFEPRAVPKAKTRTAVVIVLSSSDAAPRVTAANCLCVLEVVKEVNPTRVPAARYTMHGNGRGGRQLAADVTFPAAGSYVLDLTCSPRYTGTFDAFQKTFRTKVSA
jgi:hypothetical protein